MKFKLKYFFFIAFLWSNISSGQTTQFEKSIYNASTFYSAIEAPNLNGYFITIGHHSFFKMNSNGIVQQAWKAVPSYIYIGSQLKSFDGNLITPAFDAGGSFPGFIIIKSDTAGTILWSYGYAYDLFQRTSAATFYQTVDSGFLISGKITNPSLPFLMKIDKDGQVQWAKRYSPLIPESETQYFVSIKEDQQSNYYVLGSKYGVSRFLNKIDSTGNLLWTKGYKDGGPFEAEIYDFTFYGPQNELFLSAGFYSLIKIDSSGSVIWDKQYQNYLYRSRFYKKNSLDLVSTNTNFMFGNLYHGFNTYSFDINGNPLAVKLHAWTGNPLDTINFINRDVTIGTSDNGLLMCGYHSINFGMGNFSSQPVILKLDSSLNSICHTYPASQSIISTNQYFTDTLIYTTNTSTVTRSNFPITFSSDIITDSTICISNFIDESNKSNDQLLIYPNPNNGTFTIHLPTPLNISSDVQLIINNCFGEIIYWRKIDKVYPQQEINISLANKGLNILTITSEDFSYHSKVIIE